MTEGLSVFKELKIDLPINKSLFAGHAFLRAAKSDAVDEGIGFSSNAKL